MIKLEIVINTCYGGFRISEDALIAYAKKKGYDNVYFYDKCYNDPKIEYTKACSNGFLHYAVTKDFGDIVPAELKDEFSKYRISEFNFSRTDPDLVNVVKKLGRLASGPFADLKVVEIPDDVEWVIDNYDGVETIHEKHRVWC